MAIVMIAGLLFPPTTLAYAQDVVPPAPEGEQAEPPAEEPSSVELPAEQTVEPPAETAPVEPPAVELPPEQTVEAPIETAPTDVFPLEQTVVVPELLPTEQVVEQAGGSLPDDQGDEEELPEVIVVEVVETLAENNLTLVDADGNPVALASEEAMEIIATSDPYFTYDPPGSK